jgi:uncharacterized membrane-anchored protein
MSRLAPVLVLLASLAVRGEVSAADPADAPEAEPATTALMELTADPELAAMVAALDADTRERLDAMTPEASAAVFDKMNAGEELVGDELAVARGITEAFVRVEDAKLAYQHGDVPIEGGMATLHLGDELRFLGPAEAKKVFVDAWDNPPDDTVLGMIVPADTSPLHPEKGWGVLVTFSADGYVEDDDAEDIDYDELLEEMQKATLDANPERERQGYAALRLIGWAETPHYDAATHRLYWAQQLATNGAPGTSLNYAIRVLGRKGVLELNAVAPMEMLPDIKPAMEQVLSRVEFEAGHRYEDFDPDIDQVAAYGIGGLIAGNVLLKTGVFAGLLKILIAAKKFLILGVLALGAGIKAWFSRKRSE